MRNANESLSFRNRDESLCFFYFGYEILVRYNPAAGTDCPALQRFLLAITARKSSMVIRPRPTSKSVPTTARTILRKKRSAVMAKTLSDHCACVTVQMVVLTSVCTLQKEAKSCVPRRYCAALFMASKSKPGATRVTRS